MRRPRSRPRRTTSPSDAPARARPRNRRSYGAPNLFADAVRRLLGITAGDGAYRKGGKGERLVAKRLAKLGEEWLVLHSIPVGDKGTDIDHLVMGPGGVFSLNTKNHSGQRVWVHTHAFRVNGARHEDYLPCKSRRGSQGQPPSQSRYRAPSRCHWRHRRDRQPPGHQGDAFRYPGRCPETDH